MSNKITMPWEERPAGCKDVMWRYSENPVITLALIAGKDITEVQQFARHSNINTTMIYNHSLEKAKNSCGEAIAKAIF